MLCLTALLTFTQPVQLWILSFESHGSLLMYNYHVIIPRVILIFLNYHRSLDLSALKVYQKYVLQLALTLLPMPYSSLVRF